ncbi:MAG: AAA family ATPase [Candidatus Hydrogenedentes bacterium]|nr:AAA family ATPase [Candidatus Hydrogenedentota bacterium]
MKIAISGKGGTGKTTLAALLARTLADAGTPVIAVDADPDANLASALGIPPEEAPEPISGLKELIRERTESKNGYGAYFKINPDVRDLPEKYSRMVHGVRLLTLGGVATGGGGCICPESALLKALVTHLLLRPGEVVILDMEAGIEHLGRATAQTVSAMIIVAEPGMRSIQTAHTIRRLAAEIQIPRLGVVINKVAPGADLTPLTAKLDGLPILGTLSYDARIAHADLNGVSPYLGAEPQASEIRAILAAIRKIQGQTTNFKN